MRNNRIRYTAAVAATAALMNVRAVSATVISGASDGYGLSVNVDALGIDLAAGPLPSVDSGIAPATYLLSNTTLNVNVNASIPVVVSGSVKAPTVNGSAASNVNGLPGSRFASAAGGVNGAAISVKTLPLIGNGIDLLGINATLNSTASVTGDFGALTALGSTTIQNLSLTIDGVAVNLSAFVGVDVAPNTGINLSVLGIADASLILNQQVIAPDHHSIVVNAFDLTLNLVGLETGSVILGHSEASMSTIPTAVPEPASLAAFGLLPLAGLLRRRSRR